MGIARSTYYHKSFKEQKQMDSDLDLKKMIQEIHSDFPGYGYRRVREHLLNEGICVNAKRIRRVMKLHGLRSSRKKAVGPKGTRSIHQLYYPNLTNGLKLAGPNQLWAIDITYLRLVRGYAYLNAIIDVYTRKIVGWSLSRSLSHEFCIDALNVAIANEKPSDGIIHHSDRGTQYTCNLYVEFLKKKGFRISMSRVGTPQDNAFIESFFRTLKYEEVYVKNYRTMNDIVKNLPRFIDEIYNYKRLHSSLGYKSPKQFEDEVKKLNPADRPVHQLKGLSA